MKIKFQENGQALVIIALAAVVLFGFAALAIDGSMLFSDKRHAQNAADTAAVAAALARTRGQDLNTTGQTRATSNGYDNNGTTNIVVITTTATATGKCPGTGVDIQVKITSKVKTSFAGILSAQWKTFTNNVYATARACDLYNVGGGEPLYAGNAVYSTRTTDCGNGVSDKSIFVGGSSQIQLWGGGMGSASSDGGCLHFKGGEAQFKLSETSPKTCADINTAAPSGGTFTSVSPQDGCGNKHYGATFSTPTYPTITCSTTATKTGSSLSPGNFTGTFPGAGVTTLQPGTYCVNGDFTLNGGANLTGNGVTIVLQTGGIKWNGSMTLNLSGPSTGDYKGLVIYAPPTNSSQMTMNGSSNVTLIGTMWAPSAPCDFVGSGQIQKVTLQMICYTWQMDGSADVQIMYDSSVLYSPSLPPQDPTITILN